MWAWIKDTFDTLAKYFLDLFVWLIEFVFWIFDTVSRFLWELIVSLIKTMFDAVSEKMPAGVVEAITDSYVWLEYINEWVPIQFGITLFVAYYTIAALVYVFRLLISLLPFVNVKA